MCTQADGNVRILSESFLVSHSSSPTKIRASVFFNLLLSSWLPCISPSNESLAFSKSDLEAPLSKNSSRMRRLGNFALLPLVDRLSLSSAHPFLPPWGFEFLLTTPPFVLSRSHLPQCLGMLLVAQNSRSHLLLLAKQVTVLFRFDTQEATSLSYPVHCRLPELLGGGYGFTLHLLGSPCFPPSRAL